MNIAILQSSKWRQGGPTKAHTRTVYSRRGSDGIILRILTTCILGFIIPFVYNMKLITENSVVGYAGAFVKGASRGRGTRANSWCTTRYFSTLETSLNQNVSKKMFYSKYVQIENTILPMNHLYQ